MPKSEKNKLDKETKNYYKKLKLLEPVGKPSVSRKKIRKAVEQVMREDRKS